MVEFPMQSPLLMAGMHTSSKRVNVAAIAAAGPALLLALLVLRRLACA